MGESNTTATHDVRPAEGDCSCPPGSFGQVMGLHPRRCRARAAAQRLRRDVAAHAAQPPCGEADCLLHRSTPTARP